VHSGVHAGRSRMNFVWLSLVRVAHRHTFDNMNSQALRSSERASRERGTQMNMFRRLAMATGGTVVVLALTAGTAFAHECFNASRSAQADAQIGAHSNGHFDIQTSQLLSILLGTCTSQCPVTLTAPVQDLVNNEILGNVDPNTVISVIFGFAPESTLGSFSGDFDALVTLSQQVAADASCLGVPTSYVTNTNATMAGGAPTKVVTNGVGVEHFPDVYGAQLMAAYKNIVGGTPDC
jgi:hypothetical protein